MPLVPFDPRPSLIDVRIQRVIRPPVPLPTRAEEMGRPVRQRAESVMHDDHDLLPPLQDGFCPSDDVVSLDHEIHQDLPRHIIRHISLDPGFIHEFDGRDHAAIFGFRKLGDHLLDRVQRSVHVGGRVGKALLGVKTGMDLETRLRACRRPGKDQPLRHTSTPLSVLCFSPLTWQSVHIQDDVQPINITPVQRPLQMRDLGAGDIRLGLCLVPEPVCDGNADRVQAVVCHPIHPRSSEEEGKHGIANQDHGRVSHRCDTFSCSERSENMDVPLEIILRIKTPPMFLQDLLTPLLPQNLAKLPFIHDAPFLPLAR